MSMLRKDAVKFAKRKNRSIRGHIMPLAGCQECGSHGIHITIIGHKFLQFHVIKMCFKIFKKIFEVIIFVKRLFAKKYN